MVEGFRSVSIREELVQAVEKAIQEYGVYRSIADFISEAIRLRLEQLSKVKESEE